ncbi:transposase [Novosphingobium sp. 2638]|uniref:Transposase n=1 Tax=Novosphingobium beihaiensis TaxID=2930389 RepID=A0ABT0BVH5_9SPHN|nr:transposase [Novosphingobium beihaiensis]MCJ2189054.1 transposase [Novosphingobium beihaiensis]
MQRAKGRSSRRIQQDSRHHWGKRLWARGYFSTTSGNITDDVITAYLDRHTAPHNQASASRPEPTGFRR